MVYKIKANEEKKVAIFNGSDSQISDWFDEVILGNKGFYLAIKDGKCAVFNTGDSGYSRGQVTNWFDYDYDLLREVSERVGLQIEELIESTGYMAYNTEDKNIDPIYFAYYYAATETESWLKKTDYPVYNIIEVQNVGKDTRFFIEEGHKEILILAIVSKINRLSVRRGKIINGNVEIPKPVSFVIEETGLKNGIDRELERISKIREDFFKYLTEEYIDNTGFLGIKGIEERIATEWEKQLEKFLRSYLETIKSDDPEYYNDYRKAYIRLRALSSVLNVEHLVEELRDFLNVDIVDQRDEVEQLIFDIRKRIDEELGGKYLVVWVDYNESNPFNIAYGRGMEGILSGEVYKEYGIGEGTAEFLLEKIRNEDQIFGLYDTNGDIYFVRVDGLFPQEVLDLKDAIFQNHRQIKNGAMTRSVDIEDADFLEIVDSDFLSDIVRRVYERYDKNMEKTKNLKRKM